MVIMSSRDGSGIIPETWVSGFGIVMDKWFWGKWRKAFLHFLPKFLAYLMTFQSFSASSATFNFEKSSNMQKNLGGNEETHFSHSTSKTRNPGLRDPIHH